MVATLIQPCRVQDEGPMGCKLLLYGKKAGYKEEFDPGSGLTLAAGLIHASRTGLCFSEYELVAHG